MKDGQSQLLPAVSRPRQGEALDGYLERVAALNGLTRAETQRLLARQEPRHTTAFLVVKPAGGVVRRIGHLTGLDEGQVRAMTLQRFDDGRPLRLGDLDPGDIHDLRVMQRQGWFPTKGSQACSLCVADTGTWSICWRLPHLPICLLHGTYLTVRCPHCGRRLRGSNHLPFKGFLEDPTACGNPTGSRACCDYDLSHLAPISAPTEEVNTVHAIRDALDGRAVRLHGQGVSAAEYLNDIRQLAVLLLHIAVQPDAASLGGWVHDFHTSMRSTATGQRGPRWGLTPPEAPEVRSGVLTDARRIMEAPFQQAVELLQPWLAAIPQSSAGDGSWIRSRTVVTPNFQQLLHIARAPGRALAFQLRDYERLLPEHCVPQLIPVDLYTLHLAHLIQAGPRAGRAFASLCLVRSLPTVKSWGQAARMIGYAHADGLRIVRTVYARATTPTEQLERAIYALRADLDLSVDYRARETHVRNLAHRPELWFAHWKATHHPAMRANSLLFLITWFWERYACGDLTTSPAWDKRPETSTRVAYRAFAKRTDKHFEFLAGAIPVPAKMP